MSIGCNGGDYRVEQVARYRDFNHLERGVAGVSDDLRSDRRDRVAARGLQHLGRESIGHGDCRGHSPKDSIFLKEGLYGWEAVALLG